jgi:hypothetical protein
VSVGFGRCPGWLIVTVEQKGETLKRQEHMMNIPGSSFSISENGIRNPIGPADEREWAYHEFLIRADYDRCHPGETFDDLKYRARFSKEDQGLLSEWMTLAAWRAAERRTREAAELRRAA